MDALPALDTDAIQLPLRGLKRKANSTVGEGAKRVRGKKTPIYSGSLSTISHHSKN